MAGDHVSLTDGRQGRVARISDSEGGDPWTAVVVTDAGPVEYAVVPSQIETVRSGSRGSAQLPDGTTVREGDTVAWQGGEARVDKVLSSAPGWAALDATTIGGGRPGQRVIVTPEGAPGLRLADHQAVSDSAAQRWLTPSAIEGGLVPTIRLF